MQLVYPLHDRLPLLSLRPCPRRPAQALSDLGKLFSWRPLPVPGRTPSSSAAPMRCAPLARSLCRHLRRLAWLHSPAPRRFAHRTTDMAPAPCHADPWPSLTLPPVLSSLGVKSGQAAKSRPEFSRCDGCRGSPASGYAAARLRACRPCDCCSPVFTATKRIVGQPRRSPRVVLLTLDERLDRRQQPDLVASPGPSSASCASTMHFGCCFRKRNTRLRVRACARASPGESRPRRARRDAWGRGP